jgi:hypothetical protein
MDGLLSQLCLIQVLYLFRAQINVQRAQVFPQMIGFTRTGQWENRRIAL